MVQFRGYHEEPDTATVDLTHIRRLWPFVRPYKRAFALGLLILLVSFGLEVTGPYLLSLAVDGPIADAIQGRVANTTEIVAISLGFLAVTICAVALGYWYAMLTTRNGQRVIRDVRVELFGHAMRLGPRFFERNPAGRLVTRVTSDVENLNELIATGVLQSVFDLMKIFGILIVLLFVNAKLALVAVLATPILIAVSIWFRAYVRTSYRTVRSSLGQQNAFAAEAIGGVRITRMFGREDDVARHYSELNGTTQRAWAATVTHFAGFVALVDVTLRLAQVSILYVGGQGIVEGSISVGVFLMFWLCFGKLTEPIRELGEKYNVLQSAFSSSERIFQILDEAPTPATAASAKPSPRTPAHLQFENVGFSYRPDLPVLKDVSFEIPAGKTCALVGPTGAGKTTVLALVSRLYDPESGRILIDGSQLGDFDLFALRRRIAVVPQEVFLFTGTVLDNVRLFDDSVSEARVVAALESIGAMGFVESLEGGLLAQVQERGATFSQGERQLLAFARALVTEPDLLVLDEATANIDNQGEELIQRGLQTLLRDRTALVVAHRLSTVRGADEILVMQNGSIAERGAHDDLVALGGIYARMARLA